DDNQMIPIDFKNDFSWKGYFEHMINNLIKQLHIIIVGATSPGKSSLLSSLLGNHVNESQVARLGYFNIRSKQIQVDKFKHKYKTKVEKYR
ncbi:unnamed protein product, partial [Adineta steineri]